MKDCGEIEMIPPGRKSREFYQRHSSQIARVRRAQTVDGRLPQKGAAKGRRMSLGIALLQCHALPGVCYTRQEIAAWAGSTEVAIYQIERKALARLRSYFSGREDLLMELLRQLQDASAPAPRCAPRRMAA